MDAQLFASSAEAALRIGTGVFFACSGYNKLRNPARHAALVETLKSDRVPVVGVMQWWVPAWEFTGGILLASGFATPFAAFVLLCIMAVALLCEGKKRVAQYAPINAADRVCDWLYLPETVYALVLLFFVAR